MLDVRIELFIKMEFDRANIQGSDETNGEKSVFPVSEYVYTLVVFEDLFMFLEIRGHDRLQVASYVPSIIGCKIGRRVVSMVVSWSQVDNTVLHLVAPIFAPFWHNLWRL